MAEGLKVERAGRLGNERVAVKDMEDGMWGRAWYESELGRTTMEGVESSRRGRAGREGTEGVGRPMRAGPRSA